MGERFSSPAPGNPVRFEVVPLTAEVVEQAGQIARPAAQRPPQAGDLPPDYRIGRGDVLSIFLNESIYGKKELVGARTDAETLYQVDGGGFISLPLFGRLRVEGLTLGEAQETVHNALRQFVSSPQVNLRIAEFRSQRVTVVGTVANPGAIPVTDRPLTIIDAVIAAGALPESDLRKVVLTRDGRKLDVNVRALMDSPSFGAEWRLRDGDVLTVPENTNKVYLLGEAPNSSVVIDPNESSLAEVLLTASGAAANSRNYLQSGAAQPSRIFVIRGDTHFATVYHLNAKRPTAFLLADRFPLVDGDIVYVSTRAITRYNRFISEILPSFQSLLAPFLIIDQVDDLQD